MRNGGKHDAHCQVGQNEDKRGGEQQCHAAEDGHAEKKVGHDQDQAELDVADQDVGRDFSDQDFERARRHGEQIFHRAALAFAGDGQAGNHDHRHGKNHAHESRHDVVLRVDLRIVERVDLQIVGAAGAVEPGERSLEVVLQRAVENSADGADRIAGGDGIGGVGLDQDRGVIAAHEIAREILRDVDDEERIAALQRFLTFGLGFAQFTKSK